MKRFLLAFFFVPALVFAQKDDTNITLNTFNVYGYVKGVRLDSVQATYGQAFLPNKKQPDNYDVVRNYNFDIGTLYKSDKEIRITNRQGDPLTFTATPGFLNFMAYNGWEVVEVYFVPYNILFKKKGR